MAEEELVGEDAVGIVDEEQEEVELLGGEVDVGAANTHRAGRGVDVEIADGELGGGGFFAGDLAKVGADAGRGARAC